ncbi:MAG: hypothetical protein WCQ50_02045 [Spirochaetota bacterium]
MNVRTDWTMEFDVQRIEELQSESFARILARPKGREDWKEALADAMRLVQPAAVWDNFPISEIQKDRILLEGGASIGSGLVSKVFAGASELIIGICSIGTGLGARVKELQQGRNMMRALLLDDLGSWAVDLVRQQLCHQMEEEAAEAGLHVSTCLSPGESTWTLEDQRVIFSLLDSAAIAATLSPSLVMYPLKTLSLAMGRGREKLGHEGGSNCDFCTIKNRCAFRNRRATLPVKETT